MNFFYYVLLIGPALVYEYLKEQGIANHWCYAAFLWSVGLLGVVGLLRVIFVRRDGYRKLAFLVVLILLLPVVLVRVPHSEKGFWIAWGFLVFVALIRRWVRRCPACDKILRSVVLGYGDRVPDSQKKYDGHSMAGFECVWCWYRAHSSLWGTSPYQTPKQVRAEMLQKDRALFARLRRWDRSIVDVLRHFQLGEPFVEWWQYRGQKERPPEEVEEQQVVVDAFLKELSPGDTRTFHPAAGCRTFRDLELRKNEPERKKAFGEYLVGLRKDHGLEQVTVAVKLGLSLEDYRKLEAGELDSWESKELSEKLLELVKSIQE